MLKKGFKTLFILVAIGILLYSVFVYLVVKGLEKEYEQEKGFIINIINSEKVIVEATGIISKIEREIIGQYDNSVPERESISFAGDKGSALIEGGRSSKDGVIYIDGTINLNGEVHLIDFKYPKGTNEFSFDWDIDWSF